MMEHWAAAIGRTVEGLSGKEQLLFDSIIGGIQSALITVEDLSVLAEVAAYLDAPLVWEAHDTLIEPMSSKA